MVRKGHLEWYAVVAGPCTVRQSGLYLYPNLAILRPFFDREIIDTMTD